MFTFRAKHWSQLRDGGTNDDLRKHLHPQALKCSNSCRDMRRHVAVCDISAPRKSGVMVHVYEGTTCICNFGSVLCEWTGPGAGRGARVSPVCVAGWPTWLCPDARCRMTYSLTKCIVFVCVCVFSRVGGS